MPIKPRTGEDAYIVARQDPRDMAKAILPEVQCQSVIVGPLATASKSQVDSSPRQADGLSDLCESSTAQWNQMREHCTSGSARRALRNRRSYRSVHSPDAGHSSLPG